MPVSDMNVGLRKLKVRTDVIMRGDIVSEEQTNASMRASAISVLEAHNIIVPPINIYQIDRYPIK